MARRLMRAGLRTGVVLAVGALLAGCAQSTAPVGTPTTAAPTIALPAHPVAYFFGDSWTQGESAAPGKGYAYVASAALGWTPTFAPDGSGTGYVHVNRAGAPTFPERAATLPAHISADVVVLQGSINDEPGPQGGLDQAVATTVRLLKQKTGAPIVMLGPAPATSPVPATLVAIDGELDAEAARLGVPYISPIQGDWINSGNVTALIDSKTVHPSTVGHAYFGGRVAAAIDALLARTSTG